MLKLFVSHLGFGSLGIRGCYQRLFRTTHGHGTVTARSTPAPPFAKHDDDGGGAQKTKEGKERRNYDGIKIIKKFLKE